MSCVRSDDMPCHAVCSGSGCLRKNGPKEVNECELIQCVRRGEKCPQVRSECGKKDDGMHDVVGGSAGMDQRGCKECRKTSSFQARSRDVPMTS
jgi:hypothetical protein